MSDERKKDDYLNQSNKKPEKKKNENEGEGNDDEDVEGYGVCPTKDEKCLNDCLFGGPSFSHID